MRIQQLQEDEPLIVEEVILHHDIPGFNTQLIEKKVQTRIFTDGQIDEENNYNYQDITEYYVEDKKYKYPVDGIKSKNVYFRNHSYVISFIVLENNGFLQIKDVTIYLANPKDKNALKEAKWVIRNTINHFNWSELNKTRFSIEEGLEAYTGAEVSDNVYCLRKRKIF